MLMPPMDATTLWLLIAGVAGSFLHAAATMTRATFTRQTAIETILGGLGGVLLPNIPFFNDLRPWGQIVIAAVVCYAAGDFVINLARQIGARLPGLFPQGGKP
jgi:hypothetical protein